MKLVPFFKRVLQIIGILIGLIFLRYVSKFYNHWNTRDDMSGFQKIKTIFMESVVSTFGYIYMIFNPRARNRSWSLSQF
jgi:hypothetical protein